MPRLAPVLKTTPEIDPQRALRTIRLLGAANLVLIVALGIAVWWAMGGAGALHINATTTVEDRPVSVFMEARAFSRGIVLRSGQSVTDPIVTIRGIVADYARLREGLNGLSVTVRGTRVDIFPETGEFTERVVLVPGKNQIDIGVWWDGRQWQKNHIDVVYIKNELDQLNPSLPI